MYIVNKLRVSILFVVFGSLSVGCTSTSRVESTEKINQQSSLDQPYVILVSIDGYRYNYTQTYSPPSIQRIREEGTSAQGLMPVYPSKTFTNHYSIATGLYAENHGIVANVFYDPIRKEEYRLSNKKNVRDGSWYGGQPIWVTAEKQGMLAANYFWPGSEAVIQNERPSYYVNYDGKIPPLERVAQVKRWLELPAEKRPHLITLYFSDVDSAGHDFGPDSKEVKEAILKVDGAIAALWADVKSLNLPVNIVIVSDHGMQALDPNKVEYLDEYTNLSSARVLGDGPQVLIYFDDKKQIGPVYKELKKKAKHFRIYKRNEVPTRLHYSNNPRIGDLVLIADAPFSLGVHSPSFKVNAGNHGYDPDTTKTMQGIFYAWGPQIAKKLKIDQFRNIHIYPLLLKILGLKSPVEIDGDPSVLEKVYIKTY